MTTCSNHRHCEGGYYLAKPTLTNLSGTTLFIFLFILMYTIQDHSLPSRKVWMKHLVYVEYGHSLILITLKGSKLTNLLLIHFHDFAARGFVRGSQGNPDETRASRVLLKDYVQGKIPYAHPPPGISPSEFNCDLHEFYLSKFPKPPPMPLQAPKQHALTGNSEAQLDAEFFNTGHAGMAHVKGKYQVASGFTRMKMGVPNSSTISTDKKHRHTKKNVKVRVPVREYYEA
ncbi:hypothetical protein HMI55_000287 [Coelomomyces lativittatus]|nr:hypothetical protein HMI55_000287 [Coelomomyces lativittatus]